MIDYRSDTFTKPSAGMLEAMFTAEVGDDVFGEDPSVNKLESLAAEMFGMGEGLFCPYLIRAITSEMKIAMIV